MTGPAAASRWAPSPRQPLFTPAAVNRPRCRLAGPPLWRLDGALARNGRRRRDPRRGNADAARGQRSPDLLTPPLRRLVASPPTATSLLAASSRPLPPPLPPRLCALPAAGRWTTSPAARSPAPPLPFGRRARRQTRRLSWSLLRRSLTSWYLGEGHAQRGGSESSAPSHVHAVGRLPAWARTRTRRSQAALDDLSHVCRGRRLFTAAQL